VVDWRTGIARESGRYLTALERTDIDPAAFADAWRRRYVPAMAAVIGGSRPFVVLDTLHREMLEDVLRAYDIDVARVGESRLADWVRAWHRLDPWPDAIEGLTRLKKRFPIVTLSNGNVVLLLEMARRAGLPWDAILGAEFSRTYKPDPRAYLATAQTLGVDPGELCLVAAHHSDLAGARKNGLRTAFVHRPHEYGGAPAPDTSAKQNWDWSASDLIDLAAQLGC
jgi:2-haloacid dehalogenase